MKTILVIGKWRVEHLNTILFSNLDTGANRGVGFELVTRFLAMGYSVFGTYRPDTRDDRSVQQVDSKRATSLHELIFHCKAQRYWCEDLRAWLSGRSVNWSYSAGIWRGSARCTGQLCRSVSLISLSSLLHIDWFWADISSLRPALCHTWDDKPFTEQSDEDLLSHFKVNTIVSTPHRNIHRTAIDMSAFRDRSWPAKPFYQPCKSQNKARSSICLLTWQA